MGNKKQSLPSIEELNNKIISLEGNYLDLYKAFLDLEKEYTSLLTIISKFLEIVSDSSPTNQPIDIKKMN